MECASVLSYRTLLSVDLCQEDTCIPEGIDAFEMLKRSALDSSKHIFEARIHANEVPPCLFKGKGEHGWNELFALRVGNWGGHGGIGRCR